ncbi:hypothetical protein Scep_009851 [Stephania cephalantha]|uniref:Aminotransferase-like plant mobile domain-containing protein n=1 Tax=Stephania cephalantha TaxID=152367 RepID=A0AAP0PGJ6_9MAGN
MDYQFGASTKITMPCASHNSDSLSPKITDRRADSNSKQLSRWFPNLPDNANDVEVQRYARAYILQLLGGTLFADKSNNLVHITYLQFLEDFEATGQDDGWGSATLAHLYRQLCLAADIDGAEIAGPVILLQLWAWDRLPFLAPIMGNVLRDQY